MCRSEVPRFVSSLRAGLSRTSAMSGQSLIGFHGAFSGLYLIYFSVGPGGGGPDLSVGLGGRSPLEYGKGFDTETP